MKCSDTALVLSMFSLNHITRDDIAALTPEATRISGITYVMDLDKEEAEEILEEKGQ